MNPALPYIRAHYELFLGEPVSKCLVVVRMECGAVTEQELVRAFAQVTRERLGYDKTESVTGRKPGRIEDDNLPTRDELKHEQRDSPRKRRRERV